ncbi:MAG: hypothetical protein KatS3mg077_0574 [Candidatus Binatia bacterium]|nr:MAG: hypothetical protein KatS3mg077_0574 [Candidatus Binatia bacterium]
MADTLHAQFQIVTPVFCAGADQKGPSEIRPFSIRGALRWWYRAIDRDFFDRESKIFGATTGSGSSSPVSLQLGHWVTGAKSLRDRLQPQMAQTSGAAYLGYTFYLGNNERKAIMPGGQSLDLRLAWNWLPANETEQDYVRRAWAAALWLFGHLGGIGTRSRRGYGTLALVKWQGWKECGLLGTAHGAESPEVWKKRFESGWRLIRQWFDPPEGAKHQHFGADLKVYLWNNGFNDWKAALDEVGRTLQAFRSKREIHKPELLAAFGLPIRFRNHPAQFASPRKFSRAASPLQIRVVKIGEKYHPLLWRAHGPLTPHEALELEYKGNYAAQPPQRWDRALNEFLASIAAQCVP